MLGSTELLTAYRGFLTDLVLVVRVLCGSRIIVRGAIAVAGIFHSSMLTIHSPNECRV